MTYPIEQFRIKEKAAGFSMLEVLVAIVIISFGLLGLAGMQVTSMRNNHSAHMRSIATQQAYDMADRMRANQAGVQAGHYARITGIPAKNTCITDAAGCTAQQLASQDAFEWNSTNRDLLPSGQGIVCRDSSPKDGTPAATACDGTGPFVIKIWWNDDKNGSDLKQFVTGFQP